MSHSIIVIHTVIETKRAAFRYIYALDEQHQLLVFNANLKRL